MLANTKNKFYCQPRASPDRSSEGAGSYQSCSLKLLEVKIKSSSACSLGGLKEWSLSEVLWFWVHPRDPMLWFRLIKNKQTKKNFLQDHKSKLLVLFLNFLFYIRVCVCVHSIVSDSLQPYVLQHTSLPFHSLSPWVCSNSCPLSQWCHPTTSSSVVSFSSCPQSFLASGSSNALALPIRRPDITAHTLLFHYSLLSHTLKLFFCLRIYANPG